MAALARRTVLRGGVVVTLAALTGAVAAPAATAAVDVGAIGRDTFEDATGSRVRLVSSGGVATATLVSVDDLRHARAGHPEAFDVRFRCDEGVAAEPGLVDVELPGVRVTGVGLLAVGAPADRTVVALIDRRPVAELRTRRADRASPAH